jgi:pyruvate dehydrogenase E2 component (dihydrolipoamide acetyltransferase)
VIAEIETDKATMEYEAVDDGTLAKIVIPEGTQDVAVNSVIAVLANEGEDVKAAASASVKAPAASKAEEPKKPDTKQSAPTAQTPATPRAPRRLRRRSTVFARPVPIAFSLRPWPAVWRRRPILI